MPTLKISESIIRHNASDKSFERGKEYARSQSVQDLFWRDQTLQATVAGSTYYRVSIGFSDRGIQSATCSCPLYLGRKVKDKIFTTIQTSKSKDKLVLPLGTPSPNCR